jgi:hypothetical protein
MILSAMLMLCVISFTQYYIIRREAKSELLTKAGNDLKENQRVATVKADVESAVRNFKVTVERSINIPELYYSITSQLVNNNPHIVGAGVAFKPDFYRNQGKERLFAPYSYDEHPGNHMKTGNTNRTQITSRLISFDYTEREWYKKPMSNGKSLWTQPYMDQAGTYIVLVTYVIPIADKNGEIAGVFFADVPLNDVSIYSEKIYSGISRSTILMVVLQLLMLLVVGFVIWRAIRASERYKEQYVDPEKAHLIEQLEKLKTVNRRLTERNMDLAQKLLKKEQHTDAHYFG